MKTMMLVSLFLSVFISNAVFSDDSRPTEELSLNLKKIKTAPQKDKDVQTGEKLEKDVNAQNTQAHKPGGGATGQSRRRGVATTEDLQ